MSLAKVKLLISNNGSSAKPVIKRVNVLAITVVSFTNDGWVNSIFTLSSSYYLMRILDVSEFHTLDPAVTVLCQAGK